MKTLLLANALLFALLFYSAVTDHLIDHYYHAMMFLLDMYKHA